MGPMRLSLVLVCLWAANAWDVHSALARHKKHKHAVMRAHEKVHALIDAADTNLDSKNPDDKIHTVFSTSCNAFQ